MTSVINTINPKGLDQKLLEAKWLEKVFIFQRWLFIPAVLLTALLFGLIAQPATLALTAYLLLANLAALYLNSSITTYRAQSLLGLGMLIVDALAAVWLAFICLRAEHAVIYIVFALIITEAAARFGLKGSLIADILFSLGLIIGWLSHSTIIFETYQFTDYIVLIGITAFVSLMVGMVAKQWRKQRAAAEALTAERTLNMERHRISNELHDSVLKSLQGLSLEAHSLAQSMESKSAAARVQYINDVCRHLSQDIRSVIIELRDDHQVTGDDVASQIENQIRRWSHDTDIAIEINCGQCIHSFSLRLAYDLRCVVGEALSNIQHHAAASRVCIDLQSTHKQLELTIADNDMFCR
jgi:signal transduction histidine kinase